MTRKPAHRSPNEATDEETYVTKINALSSARCMLKSCKEVNSIIESTSYCLSYNIQHESNIKKNGRRYFQTKDLQKIR